MNREDIIQPIGKLLIGETVEPSVSFHPGTPQKEIMRIDRHGVHVSPDLNPDDVAKSVLEVMDAHIKRMVEFAVAEEREACARVCENEWKEYGYGADARGCAEEIRARGKK